MSASARRGQGDHAHGNRRRERQVVGPRWLRPVMGTRRRRIVTYAVTLACAAVAGVLAVQHETTVPARGRGSIWPLTRAC